MEYKQLYHMLDYGQQLSCVGRNGCGICYKKRGNNTNICAIYPNCYIQLKFVWLINSFPTWCIVTHEMDPLVYVNSYLDGVSALPRGRFAPYVTLYVPHIGSFGVNRTA